MKERLWNRSYVHIICFELALQMGLNLTNPIVSNYVVSLGMSVAIAGFVAGLNSAASVVMRPISGFMSDRLHKKNLMVFSAAMMAVAVFGCAFTTSISAIGFFRVLLGVAFAFKSIVSISMVSLVVPPSLVGRGVGWFSLAFTTSCAIGPAIGAEVGATMGYQVSFFLAGALLCIGLILAVTFKAPDSAKPHVPPDAAQGRLKELIGFLRPSRMFYAASLPLAAIALFLTIGQGAANSLILLTSEMRGIAGASIYFTVYAAVCLVSRPMAGRVSDKYGLGRLFIPMSFCAVFGMLVLAFTSSFVGVAIAGGLSGLGHASTYSALQAEAVRYVDARKVGRAVSTFYIGPDLGVSLGPIIGGLVLQGLGVTALYLFAAGSFFTSLLLYLILWRKQATKDRPASGRLSADK